MGLDIDVQADIGWESTSITWFKTFSRMQFQTYIYNCYVSSVIKQLRENVTITNFDPDLIRNLQDKFNSSRV